MKTLQEEAADQKLRDEATAYCSTRMDANITTYEAGYHSGMAAYLSEVERLQAENEKLKSDFEEYMIDQRKLVRELDVIINGESGAAKQASLCDIVSQMRNFHK